MLITFYSDAYENLTYFGDVAKQLLALMGHSGSIPGAMKARELVDALSRLQQGLAAAKPSSSSPTSGEDEEVIDLAKRAVPLINLLQAAISKNADVLWK